MRISGDDGGGLDSRSAEGTLNKSADELGDIKEPLCFTGVKERGHWMTGVGGVLQKNPMMPDCRRPQQPQTPEGK